MHVQDVYILLILLLGDNVDLLQLLENVSDQTPGSLGEVGGVDRVVLSTTVHLGESTNTDT